MLHCSHVPDCFGMSCVPPIMKNNVNIKSKTITVDDFRGISTCPVISKVFEHCVLVYYIVALSMYAQSTFPRPSTE